MNIATLVCRHFEPSTVSEGPLVCNKLAFITGNGNDMRMQGPQSVRQLAAAAKRELAAHTLKRGGGTRQA